MVVFDFLLGMQASQSMELTGSQMQSMEDPAVELVEELIPVVACDDIQPGEVRKKFDIMQNV